MRRPGEEGYTLLEVLVAFVILSGAVIMSFRIFGDGLARLNATDRQIRMVATAQDQLSQLQLKPVLQPGITSGVSGEYTWTVTLTPYPGKANAPGAVSLVRVRVEVHPQHQGDASAYDLETTLLAVTE
jgi:general secretion pathway protein I